MNINNPKVVDFVLIMLSIILLILIIGIIISLIKSISVEKQIKRAGLDFETLYNLRSELTEKARKADNESKSQFYAAQALIISELEHRSLNVDCYKKAKAKEI